METRLNTDSSNNSSPANYPDSLSRMEFYATDRSGNIVRFDSRSAVPSRYTHILTGVFGVTETSANIFCYDAASGQGDVWARTSDGGLLWQSTNTSLPTGCTLAVDAKLTNDSRVDIVLYNAQSGTVYVYRIDQLGKVALAQTITGMRATWTNVVRGNFNDDPYHTLFFYDAAAGHGEFWITDGTGKLTKAREHPGLRKGCSIVLQANVTGVVNANDVVLYDAVEGVAVMCTVEKCQILAQQTSSWRPGFSKILPINCFGGQWTDFLCYDPAKGNLAIYRTDGTGKLTLATETTGIPSGWTAMASTGTFKSGPATSNGPHFVCYNQSDDTVLISEPEPTVPDTEETQSRLDFYATNDSGDMVLYDTYANVHPGYTHIVTGEFGSGGNDIFGYDSVLGRGDVWTRNGQGKTVLLASNTSLRKGATLVVEAKLTGSKLDIVLYDAPKGEIDIYQVDKGKLTLAKTATKIETSWTHVVRGNFDGDPYDAMLFYDGGAGRAEFYITDGQGNLRQGDITQVGLTKGCTSVVKANLLGAIDQNDIWIFNSNTSMGEMIEIQSPGCIPVKSEQVEWLHGITQVVTVNSSTTAWSDLLGYSPAKGELSIYKTTGTGILEHHSTLSGAPKDWTHLSGGGTFNGGPGTHSKSHFVCYNHTVDSVVPTEPTEPTMPTEPTVPTEPGPTVPTEPGEIKMTGRLSLFTIDDSGTLTPQVTLKGIRAWTHMLSGTFSRGNVNKVLNPDGDLFFYDAVRGEAETIKIAANGKPVTIGRFTGLMKGAIPAVFNCYSRLGGIALYSPDTGISLYDATLGKMDLLTFYPKTDGNSKFVLSGNFSTNSESIDFILNNGIGGSQFWRTDKQGSKLVYLNQYSKGGVDGCWTNMVHGRFSGSKYDDIYTYDLDYGVYQLLLCGQPDPVWFKQVPYHGVRKPNWHTLTRVTLGIHQDLKESILFYSNEDSLAEVRGVQIDGNLTTLTSKSDVGKFDLVTQLPATGITKRVAFFSPTGE